MASAPDLPQTTTGRPGTPDDAGIVVRAVDVREQAGFAPRPAAIDRLARHVFSQGGTVRLTRIGNGPVRWHLPARARFEVERFGGSWLAVEDGDGRFGIPTSSTTRGDPMVVATLPAPVSSAAVDVLGRLDLGPFEWAAYEVRGELAGWCELHQRWRAHRDPSTLFRLHGLVSATSAECARELRRRLAAPPHEINGSRVGTEFALLTGRALEWLLVPRAVEVSRPSTTSRPLRVPGRMEVPLGRSLDGELLTMPLEHLTSAFCFGRAGHGKSTWLSDVILHLALLRRGETLIVVDPHSDLVEKVRPWLRSRQPIDIDLGAGAERPQPGWNPLRPLRPVSAHQVVRAVVGGLAAALSWEGRFRRLVAVANLAVRTLVELGELLPPELAPTVFEVGTILTDEGWRRTVTVGLPHLAAAWEQKQSAEAVAGIVGVLEELRQDPASLALFGQSVSTFDPREAMDGAGVVLIRPGRSVGYLAANLMMAGFVNAALARTDTRPEDRVPVRLVVDELQIFGRALAVQVVALLEQARKFGVSFIGANQSPRRLPEVLLHAALVNRSALLSFAQDASSARLLAAELGGAIEPEALITLAKHHAIASVERGNGARGAPVEIVSVRPEQLYVPSTLVARETSLSGRMPADVEHEVRERPAAIVAALGGAHHGHERSAVRADPGSPRDPLVSWGGDVETLSRVERRRRALELVRDGLSRRAVARELSIPRGTLHRWLTEGPGTAGRRGNIIPLWSDRDELEPRP